MFKQDDGNGISEVDELEYPQNIILTINVKRVKKNIKEFETEQSLGPR